LLRLENEPFCAPNAEMLRSLETFLAALTVATGVGGPAGADALFRDFAVCTGRYSALVEHQWLVGGPESGHSARVRDALWTLVEAVAAPEESPAAMALRIEAKAGQKALLSRAFFAGDRAAEVRSAQLLQACADLVGQS
jgi:hypothetical protein